MFYWIKTHWTIKKIFWSFLWDIPNKQNKIYLTFDDGPTPQITNWVLDLLKKYHAKATFFCVGINVQRHPDIFLNIVNQRHGIGNHTQNHLNGWKNSTKKYVENVTNCILNSHEKTRLFRPPYGKITFWQLKIIRQLGYKIIMWDVLSADFDNSISKEKCLLNVLKNIKPGSIVVFHDSQKAFKNLEFVLPKTLEYIAVKGWICDKIDSV
ncbi:MAG: Peptidoglycan-N-acetylglucosamine deacetylase [Bacteroidota bacterium]|jgi:peptidoglycan/xylan/chitin deacetylase (PgdA/CDA1 family)